MIDVDMHKIYVLKKELEPLCCANTIPIGTQLRISHQHSKNRVYVFDIETMFTHKVKFSSLRKCVSNG